MRVQAGLQSLRFEILQLDAGIAAYLQSQGGKVPRETSDGRYLTPEEARRVYNRIGRLQDWQSFYEGPAIRELVQFGEFQSAKSVFEFGCGTGAFAAKLMKIVPAECRYAGIDVSPKMARLAASRLEKWAGRASITLSDGAPILHEPDGAFDRFVSTYVFELLAPEYAAAVLAEAHRILCANGKLCLVSLGCGTSGISRAVTAMWEAVWRCKPKWVGGCKPSDLGKLLTADLWEIAHHGRVVSFGLTSEVFVATRRSQ